VLELMATCDVLALPSIVEGRALVQQEAMSRGLPLVATRNAGGEDLIEEGKTGFLVPIRAPEAVAERLERLAQDRGLLEAMSAAAWRKAEQFTWEAYAAGISAALPP
jgi:glycosyltransferase involved in cell wall biosynthesis